MAILRRLRQAVAGLVALTLAAPAPLGAANSPAGAKPRAIVSTQAVYAAFTLNLTRFVSWPESAFAEPEAALMIGTMPRDPINAHLDAAAKLERFNNRPIRTIRIRNMDDVAKCHVIFMPKNHPRQAAVLERAAGKPILTISDAEGFLALGGHVQFVPQPPHTKLKVSVENLKASGLAGRSQLLRLAAQ